MTYRETSRILTVYPRARFTRRLWAFLTGKLKTIAFRRALVRLSIARGAVAAAELRTEEAKVETALQIAKTAEAKAETARMVAKTEEMRREVNRLNLLKVQMTIEDIADRFGTTAAEAAKSLERYSPQLAILGCLPRPEPAKLPPTPPGTKTTE